MASLREKPSAKRISWFLLPDKGKIHNQHEEQSTKRQISYSTNLDLKAFFNPDKKTSKKHYCSKCLGRTFPHLFFISSLIIYALLGAALFSFIESRRDDRNVEFEAFLLQLWNNCNSNGKETETERKLHFIMKTRRMLLYQLKHEWLLSPTEWSFLGSLFFCCTVFTTVGYGHMYPITGLGKALCMLYAFFGIPLMFIVMTALGDVLTSILSMLYNNYKNLRVPRLTLSQIRRHSSKCTDSDLVNQTLSHNVVRKSSHKVTIQKDMNTNYNCLMEQSQNLENFEKIAREERESLLYVPSDMQRSHSCPELQHLKSQRLQSHRSLRDLGKIVENFDVPIIIIALVVFAYISFGAAILPLWETQLDFGTAFYFCFITFTTIGFGDIKLENTFVFLFCSIYVVIGMEIVIITFKLLQDRLFHAYQAIILFFTKWDVE
ncbi:potassium channel subfamily K member 18 [Antechinus flavipes]|uniref:potassium channel subfamily K member 18 n=1 Tax=Antechinus flavipes TaxID=38775 RepID=UPI00223670D0|nr:potassium channel subfamily K member 18 [Antechinus flavipes]XP_051837471.1 potassium channel subfamily K member 18 [Antechinus flavipes]